MSVAKRVSEEMEVSVIAKPFKPIDRLSCLIQVKLGGLVGYAIRFEDCTSPETKIKCNMMDPLPLKVTLVADT